MTHALIIFLHKGFSKKYITMQSEIVYLDFQKNIVNNLAVIIDFSFLTNKYIENYWIGFAKRFVNR